MKTSDFDYNLPEELIAQTPIEHRDQSRLMLINRDNGSFEHHNFYELVDFLNSGDVLVLNDSRVIPARLYGEKSDTGGKLELLLLRQIRHNTWETLIKRSKRVNIGAKIEIKSEFANETSPYSKVMGEVIDTKENGVRIVQFSDESLLPILGKIPLPPYIHEPLSNPERYQTVYADTSGSVAAPTAGLHFTPELLDRIKTKGVCCQFITLHVGLDTFRPITEEDPREHIIHSEYGIISPEAAAQLSQAKKEGRRIICAGTTTVRLIEAVVQSSNTSNLEPFQGWVELFILPGYEFKMVDSLITNFHLPKSTLLMLVAAFTGYDLILKAYHEAISQKYRFYSFGDAMLIT